MHVRREDSDGLPHVCRTTTKGLVRKGSLTPQTRTGQWGISVLHVFITVDHLIVCETAGLCYIELHGRAGGGGGILKEF